MKINNRKQGIISRIFLTVILSLLIFLIFIQLVNNSNIKAKSTTNSSQDVYSLDTPHLNKPPSIPANRTLLSDGEITGYTDYGAYGSEYFHYTYDLLPTDYHMIWLETHSSEDNFDLYVYSDSSYSNFVASSSKPFDELDWVVYNPALSEVLYPKILTSGEGLGFIQVKSARDIEVNHVYETVDFTSSHRGDIFEIELSSSTEYTVTLTSGYYTDMDLYIFRVGLGSCTKIDYHESKLRGNYWEQIVFTPSSSGKYAIVIVEEYWYGSLELSVNTTTHLYDDVRRHDYYYTINGTYSYDTYNMVADEYNLIWLRPLTHEDIFDLHVYSDITHTNLIGSSTKINNQDLQIYYLNLVAYRPTSIGAVYPRGYANNCSGRAYIGAESSNKISLGDQYNSSFSDRNYADIAHVNLSNINTYRISFNPKYPGWFNLHVFRLIPGSTTKLEYCNYSSLSYNSPEIEIIFTPEYNDYYAIVIEDLYSGTSSGILSVNLYNESNNIPEIPGFTIISLIIGIICMISLSYYILKRRNTRIKAA